MSLARQLIREAVARRSDPDTSHEAAATVRSITMRQHAILRLVRTYGPVSDQSIIALYTSGMHAEGRPPQSESGIRTRRSELVDLGLVVHSGYGRTRSGRRCRLWSAA